jgi:hypothetical protein
MTFLIPGLPHCTGESNLVDGGRINLTCESETAGNDMPSLEWFKEGEAIESRPETELGWTKQRLVIDATPDLDKVIFTCRMSFGSMQEECTVPMNIKCELR